MRRSNGLPPLPSSRAGLQSPASTSPLFQSKQTRRLDEDTNWLITLSDLTLLLLCFLAIWHVTDKKKNSLQLPQTAVPEAVAVVTDETPSAQNPSLQLMEELGELRVEIERHVESLGLSEGVTLLSTEQEILLTLKDTIPFALGKADLRPEVLPVLEKVAAIALDRQDLDLEVIGHTDDLPIATSKYPTNWELSGARASRVARYMIKQGVDPARIAVQGYAYHRPLRPNTSPENRESNRRVEIRLYRTRNPTDVTN